MGHLDVQVDLGPTGWQCFLGLALWVEGSIFPSSELHRLVGVARLAEAAGADYVMCPSTC
jgi:hypothetical protein